jgi:hypothetical protein
MPDDLNDRGPQDRARIAEEEPYEVAYFARKHGLSSERAREIIDRYGPSREACDRAAMSQ